MNVLVACEYSGIVRDAFIDAGHEAMSCDLLPSESDREFHFQGDIFECLESNLYWDLIIAHPPCTALCVAGNRHYSGTQEREDALEWTARLWRECFKASGSMVFENPVGVLSSKFRPPDQYIQPWQFGHGETKKTGLWLDNLPPLEPTNIVNGREQRIWKMAPHPDRPKERSRFYPGIAQAMAEQWGHLVQGERDD
jgi:site-specific DNA-cytosine methylase